MKIERMAALANIVALLPGGYCAYGTYVLLHPTDAVKALSSATGAASPTPPDAGRLLAALAIAGGLFVLGAILNSIAAFTRSKTNGASSERATDWREAFRNPHFSLVSDHKYENDSIQVDGKSFRRCSFKNVTFHFQGNAPFEFVEETHLDSGSVRFVTDNPAIILYNEMTRKFAAVASEAIAAGRAKVEIGALDAKGHEVPLRLPTVQRLGPADNVETLSDADPRIYLIDIKEAGDAMFQRSPFLLKNGGGTVAHNIQVQPLTFGYQKVTFPSIDTLLKDATVEVVPVVAGAEMNEHNLLPVLQAAWNAVVSEDYGKLVGVFPFSLSITCQSFDGSRTVETTVEMEYSYLTQAFNDTPNLGTGLKENPVKIVRTTFKLLS
jgi:hypothetical protein